MTDVGGQKGLKGIAVSPGIIIGKAHLVDRSQAKILYQYLVNDDQLSREVERFKAALLKTEEQLVQLKKRMPSQVKEHAYILDSHLMLLKESMLRDSTIERILNEKINAEWALKKSLEEIRGIFDQIHDEYISARIRDVENVVEQILRNLSGQAQENLGDINDRAIIVAHDLSPADTTELNLNRIKGFITDVGGRTSHTAIMAQALEIPAVVGLESVTHMVADGDLLIVDGSSGEVIINPAENAIIYYEEKHLKDEAYKSSIAKTRHLPSVTLDGHKIAIRANIEFLAELAAAKDNGCEGVGLYRTELPYLRSKGFPSEETLFQDYQEMAKRIAPEPVTIRTLDLGGDKIASVSEMTRQMNPALGLRAIRLCLKRPDIFKTQLRAILKASAYGRVELMFPMISGLQELLDAKEILKRAKEELEREKVAYDPNLKVGIMIEVPSAVTMAEVLAKQVDFFSIGTNDLIQYSLAIDRTNEYVAYMYQPFHPAIIRMIKQVVDGAASAGIGVALCGEMAGDPLCVPILLSLGIRELSMNARATPIVKKVIRSLSIKELNTDFSKLIRLTTAREVRAYMVDRLKGLIPEREEKGFLDTSTDG